MALSTRSYLLTVRTKLKRVQIQWVGLVPWLRLRWVRILAPQPSFRQVSDRLAFGPQPPSRPRRLCAELSHAHVHSWATTTGRIRRRRSPRTATPIPAASSAGTSTAFNHPGPHGRHGRFRRREYPSRARPNTHREPPEPAAGLRGLGRGRDQGHQAGDLRRAAPGCPSRRGRDPACAPRPTRSTEAACGNGRRRFGPCELGRICRRRRSACRLDVRLAPSVPNGPWPQDRDQHVRIGPPSDNIVDRIPADDIGRRLQSMS